MTIREKLKELHEWIQQSYGFGEIFFRGNLEYRLELIKKIMLSYASEFPDLKYHVEKNHLHLIDASFSDTKYLAEKYGYNAPFEIQNNFLNSAKSNAARGYWSFTQFVEGKRDGFLDKPFDEYQFVS